MNIPQGYLSAPIVIREAFGMTNIAHYRKLRGLSQSELAELVGVRQPHISRIEGGDEGPPLKLFRDIADALEVSLADLFAEDLSRAEIDLLQGFRSLPAHLQKGWIEMAKAAASPGPKEGQ